MKKCSVLSCDRDSFQKGFCSRHYYRWAKYGDPHITKQVQFHGLTVEERFWKYVKKTPDCWEWVGSKMQNYGMLNVGGKPKLASRLSWEIHYGPIPANKMVLHKCDNPSCTNPEHLYIGNQFNNMADMWNRGRANPGHVFGEKHGMSKLTDEAVRFIRQSTDKTGVLAAQFNVSKTTIQYVRTRKCWQHIE